MNNEPRIPEHLAWTDRDVEKYHNEIMHGDQNTGPNDPVFDECLPQEIVGEIRDIVLHRDAAGVLVAYHSPLTAGAIKCSICEGGARVYIR